MRYLTDTNLLVRYEDINDPQRVVARSALAKLRAQGHELHLTPQNLVEFWGVATRPKTARGLGLTEVQAEIALNQFERDFRSPADTARIYPVWKHLVLTNGVTGKQVHDTRLAAVCLVYGVPNILTFNGKDFRRFLSSGLTAVDPATV